LSRQIRRKIQSYLLSGETPSTSRKMRPLKDQALKRMLAPRFIT